MERTDMSLERKNCADYHTKRQKLTHTTQLEDSSRQHEDAADDDSDEGSLFHFVGDQGDGTVSRLCHHCQWMVDNWAKFEEDPHFAFPHHENVYKLKSAADAGCALCHQFCRSNITHVQEYQNNIEKYSKCEASGVRVQPLDEYRPSSAPEVGTVELILRFLRLPLEDDNENYELSDDDFSREFASFEVFMFPATYHVPITSPHSLSKISTHDSLDLAARWLRKCQKSHWKCTNSIGDFIPTRLIALGQGSVHLALAKDISEPTAYATLSHCWGKSKFDTLSTKNIALFRDGIPQEALSKTIQDAIEIAIYLGFNYLWVDTLCILQDDFRDWERESSSMSAVYGSSSLNIAASGAADGSIGCFFERQHQWRCQAKVQKRGSTRLHNFVMSGFGWRTLSNMPLMERGWALQERLLAPRTLHFTQAEVFWECHHKFACESYPDEVPWQCKISKDTLTKQPLGLSMWSWIVENYSTCKLTYPKDKLIAISGLAQYIQNQTKDQYVAGMWRESLEFQLCWSTSNPVPRRESDVYIAPTWSWASVDSLIDISIAERPNDYKKDTTLWIVILRVDTRTFDSNPFGPLSSAMLRLSCKALLPVRTLTNSMNQVDFIVFDHESIDCLIKYDARYTTGDDEWYEVYALPILGSSNKGGGVTGLLLEPVGPQRGVYQRVGRFRFWSSKSLASFERVVASLAPKVNDEDCFEVKLDKHGEKCYIIHII